MLESVVPLCLGFGRFLIIKSTDYQEHASEYGIHWNFFTTIALINVLQVFIRNHKIALPLAFCMLVVYEFGLSEFGLKDYIFYAPRETLISANREGICSLVGYFGI